ncbi:MAG: RNA 2',3'-cyclic phosphodiesterase [Gemmatimonadales bacterium]|jgi:2'-5' RNA ligase
MRLFVAVNLPQDVRHALWEAVAPLRTRSFPVRWVASEGLHVTLKFLGEVPAEREPQVIAGLERAVGDTRPFSLVLSGFGAFPSLRRPRVLWAGCESARPLELLQHGVEREMAELGFPLEGRPFRPHITIGRVRRGARARDLAGLDDAVAPLSFEAEVGVTSLDLMQSMLARAGATYACRHAVGFVS